MATRRIARGRGASPVPIIILSVVVVGLLSSTIVLALQMGKLDDQVKKLQDDVVAEQTNRVKDQKRFQEYIHIVGLNYDGAVIQFEKLKNELSAKAPVTNLRTKDVEAPPKTFENMVALLNTFADRTAVLETNVGYMEDQLKGARTERDGFQTSVGMKEKLGTELVDREKEVTKEVEKKRAEIEAEFAKTGTELKAQLSKLNDDKTQLIKDLNAAKKEAEIRGKKIEERDKRIKDLLEAQRPTNPLTGKRDKEKPPPEEVDGRVLNVDADGKHVMIDIGRRDWVDVGMDFAVYDQADPDSRKEKGHLQVRKVFDKIAQAKVIKQDAMDPILPGMYIVNPAFHRGKTLEFVLDGRFRDPNMRRTLSRYPCRVAEKVGRTTDYLIQGKADRKAGDPAPEDSPEFQRAKELGITVMSETELLRYLGELD